MKQRERQVRQLSGVVLYHVTLLLLRRTIVLWKFSRCTEGQVTGLSKVDAVMESSHGTTSDSANPPCVDPLVKLCIVKYSADTARARTNP